MGNTFGPNGLSNRFQPTGFVVKVPQIVVHEGDEPDALADLCDTDVLAGKDVAQIHLLAFEAIRPQCVTVIVWS